MKTTRMRTRPKGEQASLFHAGSSRRSATVTWVWQRLRHSLEWPERPGCGLMEAVGVQSGVDQKLCPCAPVKERVWFSPRALNLTWGQMLRKLVSLTMFWATVQRLWAGFQAGHCRGCRADLSWPCVYGLAIVHLCVQPPRRCW